MVLVLSVLRCPPKAVPEQRRVPGGEFVLGRGAECDWVFDDPDRVLSKRHCAVEYLAGAWQVRDLSTNGTFLNAATEPLGRDKVRPLRDGDRLRLGAWEIECRIEAEAGVGEGRWQSSTAIPDPMAPRAAASDDIFSAPLPGLSPAGGTPGGAAPLLPADFDPFAPADPGPVMPDHRPSTNDVFTPPRATMPDLLPDDWNAPPATPPARGADPFAALPDPFAQAPPQVSPPTAAPGLPAAPPPAQPVLGDPFADLGLAPAAPVRPVADPLAEVPRPALPVLPDPFAEPPPPAAPPLPDPFAQAAPVPPVAPTPVAAPPVAAPPIAAPRGSLDEALALLLRGAGLPPPPPGTDSAAALAQAGQALRAAVSGLRALLIARADVKREFRIEQTMLRAAGNNALKFAATDEAALHALLSPRTNGLAAVQETVQDLTAHQLATVAATQAAARALLDRLAPAGVEADVPSGGFALPGAREKRLWEAYRKLHQQVSDQFEDDFDSAFGKAFARAYEQATRGGR
jgi:type VI secretion system protein ImpI/type VI secretion system protein